MFVIFRFVLENEKNYIFLFPADSYINFLDEFTKYQGQKEPSNLELLIVILEGE